MTRSLAFLVVLALVPALWLSVTLAGRVDDTVELAAVSTSTDRHGDIGAWLAGIHDRTPPTFVPTTTSTQPASRTKRAVRQAHGAVYPSDALLYDLAMCETGGKMDPATNTGNGFYGAFQFTPSTWQSIGGPGMPHHHSYETQRDFARALILRSGWSQFPVCSYRIGAR